MAGQLLKFFKAESVTTAGSVWQSASLAGSIPSAALPSSVFAELRRRGGQIIFRSTPPQVQLTRWRPCHHLQRHCIQESIETAQKIPTDVLTSQRGQRSSYQETPNVVLSIGMEDS